jgi:hypothetical protein
MWEEFNFLGAPAAVFSKGNHQFLFSHEFCESKPQTLKNSKLGRIFICRIFHEGFFEKETSKNNREPCFSLGITIYATENSASIWRLHTMVERRCGEMHPQMCLKHTEHTWE